MTAPGISNSILTPVLHALARMGYVPSPDGPKDVDGFIEHAAAALGDPHVGVAMAAHIPIGALGPLDYALCTSATVREALTRVSRHYGAVTERVTLRYRETSRGGALVFTRLPGIAHSRHWPEFALAMFSTRLRQTVGRAFEFAEVAFVHAAPSDSARIDGFFGVPVRFGATDDVLAVPATVLAFPLLTAASSLASVLDRGLNDSEGNTEVDALVDRLRQLIREGVTDLSTAAARMKLRPRTVQRELARRETTFRALLDEYRRARALELLEAGGSLADISYQLGFSQPSAFFRAFRRWTRSTPLAVRKTGSR
jgi:AraC-like DNA-binding protein